MDEAAKRELARPLTEAEKFIRTYTNGDTIVRVMYTGNLGWLNVAVRTAGVLRYTESHSGEAKAMKDFAERCARVDLAAMMAASEKATRELEANPINTEEDRSRDALADLAEEMMEHEGIDRTYILEALISDLRGGDTSRGLRALFLDRTEGR